LREPEPRSARDTCEGGCDVAGRGDDQVVVRYEPRALGFGDGDVRRVVGGEATRRPVCDAGEFRFKQLETLYLRAIAKRE
jgi:hypothetical protein